MASSHARLTLIQDAATSLSLDPVEIDERLPSVAFIIRISRTANPQTCRIDHRCWFDHESLNLFEKELSQFFDRDNAYVCLADLSQHPKLEFERNGDDVLLRCHALEAAEQANVILTVSMTMDGVRDVLLRLHEYPKWW